MAAGEQSATSALALRAQREMHAGRCEPALDLLRRALALEPGRADLSLAAAVAAFELGDGGQAKTYAERAVALAPDFAEAHVTLGHVLRAVGDRNAAEACYRRAAALAPRSPAVLASLGGLLLEADRPDEAEPIFRRAVEAAPRAASLRDAHAQSLERLARTAEAERAYRSAVEADPRFAPAIRNLGNLLLRLGRPDAAVAQYRRALEIAPDDAGAWSNLGLGLYRLGKLEEAERASLRAVAARPDDAKAHYILSCVRLKAGAPEGALAAADGCLACDPGNGSALALKAILLAELDRPAEAGALVDYERFLRSTQLAAAPGYAGVEAFNAALAQQVASAPSRLSEPGTERMRQTHDLMRRPDGAVAAFAAAVDDAVRGYVATLPADASHPFLARRPRRWRLTAWATLLRESPADEASHLHPTAWLSGVYYPRVPPAVAESGEHRAGWIEFGRPPPHLFGRPVNGLRVVRPQEGLLLLFPSYFYHRVRPFGGDGLRISVAFDVTPEE